ncbi:MAG: hypothetical protein EA398_07755, partial [Deltaproteobacteria bacterium]
TDPAPTDPAPTDPVPTDPVPTDPAPTDPEPTEPCANVDCSGLDDACERGVCDEATGECVAEAVNEGASCDDGDPCTVSVCVGGVCAGPAVDCSGLDGACVAGTCDEATGECAAAPANEGVVCDDGDLCTENVCEAGVCVVVAVETCPTLASSCTAGVCDPVLGCTFETVEDGTACVPNPNFCAGTPEAICQAGICTPRQAPDCDIWSRVQVNVAPTGWFGPTESAVERLCPESYYLTAVEGYRSTQFGTVNNLTQVRLRCMQFDPEAMENVWRMVPGVGPFAELLLPADGTASHGGELLTSSCPEGHAAVGIETFGSVTQPTGLRLRCAPFGFDDTLRMRPAGPEVAAPWLGVNPGIDGELLSCAPGAWVNGADVVSGLVVDGLRLRCTDLRVLHTRTGVVTGRGSGVIRPEADCPAGRVPVGIRATGSIAFWSGSIAGFQIRCAPAAVDLAADPPEFRIAPAAEHVWHPPTGFGATTSGGTSTALCPAGEVVAAFTANPGGREGRISGVTLHCGVPVVTGTAEDGYALSVPPGTSSPRVGAAGGTRIDCDEGLVFANFWLRSGEVIDAISNRCRAVELWRP